MKNVDNKRYYLHRKIKQWLRIKAREHVIMLPYNYELKGKAKYYYNKLIALGYTTQIEIV